MQNLYEIVKTAMQPGKGILASDESPNSITKKLESYNIEPNDTNITKLRELFINTPNLENFISTIIISEPTFWNKDTNEKLFKDTLKEKGILICVKVDKGLQESEEFNNQKITLGLDGLSERLSTLHTNGARLAKWRSLITISENKPTDDYLVKISNDLGSYALACQENGIVPIVEPEVYIKGNHSIQKASEVTTNTLKILFEQFNQMNVDLKAMLLKTSMILPGTDSGNKATPQEVATATVKVLGENVPDTVGGVVFLSGGQSPQEATNNFNAIAKHEPLPWPIAFSFLRAIEGPPTEIWAGDDKNVDAAREKFLELLRINVLADSGLV